jgi:hypothetical protein
MANPTTRAGLVAYCKRSLGYPVLEINVDDDQVEDRVDEALEYFREYHSDATYRGYFKHQMAGSWSYGEGFTREWKAGLNIDS